MWCPNCEKESEPQNGSCKLCGAELIEFIPETPEKASWNLSFGNSMFKKWPHDENGQPEQPAFLAHCTSVNMEDRIMINMLDAYGIPAVKYFPQNGCFGKIVLGISAEGADIYVPESVLVDAKALIVIGEDKGND